MSAVGLHTLQDPVKLGKLYEVKINDLPAWEGRTGYDTPDRLAVGEWLIVVRQSSLYSLYGKSIRNVTFLCHLGVRSCYSNHILENCVDT